MTHSTKPLKLISQNDSDVFLGAADYDIVICERGLRLSLNGSGII